MTATAFPPFALITGPEEILAERAIASVIEAVKEHEPDVDVVRVHASGYEPGALGVHAGPSLFGGGTVLVVHDFDEADEALVDDVKALLTDPADDVTLVVRHKSGNRAKGVLDALKKAGARVIECKALKNEGEKVAFVTHEFRAARRRIDEAAAVALVQAMGKDVRELATAAAQLIRDTTGTVGVAAVQTYYGDRVETTGFKVAEAAVAGDHSTALSLWRHALAGGLDPVPVVAVLAMRLRQVGRVATAGGASSGSLARDLSMAPWQIDQARREARGWDSERLGAAIRAVAAADVEVKGGVRTGTAVARDPEYAVERAILAVCRERRGG